MTLTCATPGAIMRYTTDGTNPTAASTLYTGPVMLSVTTTLKATAFKAGMTDSVVATGLYTIAVLTPVLTPAPGAYIGATTVTITCATPGAVIRYTTDGTIPTAASAVYTSPITLTLTTMLQAYASATGLADSAVAGGTYAITINTPVFTPAPGPYVGSRGRDYHLRNRRRDDPLYHRRL